MVWFYHLIHEELKRRRYKLKGQEPPSNERATGGQSSERSTQPSQRERQDEDDPLDELVTEKDALDLLEHDLRGWPRHKREVFEWHYVEGLEPEEIAQTTGYALQAVKQALESVRQKLRQRFHEEELTA